MRALHVGVLAIVAACAVKEPEPGDVKPGDEVVDPGDTQGQGQGVTEAPGLRTALPVSGTPSGSGVIVDAGGSTFVADTDAGKVAQRGAKITDIAVGAEPTRVVARGPTVWATLRADGELVRVGTEGGITVEDRVPVGAEPFDVVASGFADRLYVSLSQEDAVVALDARTLEVVGRWSVPGEPRDLLMLDLGDGIERVVVASGRRARITVIEPVSGRWTAFDVPSLETFDALGTPLPLSARLSGDLVADPEGRVIAPGLLADTDLRERPPLPPDGSDPNMPPDEVPPELPPGDTGHALPGDTGGRAEPGGPCENGGGGAYGQPVDPDCKDPGSVGRFTPVLVSFDVRPSLGQPVTLFGIGSVVNDARGGRRVVRGYPTSVALVQDPAVGSVAFVSMPTEDALVAVALSADAGISDPSTGSGGATTNNGVDADGDGFVDVKDPTGLVLPARVAFQLTGGPLGLAFDAASGGLSTWGLHDRVVRRYELGGLPVGEFLLRGGAQGMVFMLDQLPNTVSPAFAGGLSADLVEGRRLFMSARDARMAAAGSGVSCDTCHVDGRSDGFTWVFDDMQRQTPNLAGRVSDTLPITWLGEVDTVAQEVLLTTSNRMGGVDLSEDVAEQIARFVDSGRAIVRPQPKDDAARALVAEGKALFQSAEVGCATCHAGATGTDGRNWRVLGYSMATNTPTLRGIGGSAPYFHDGTAATLRDVLLRARNGSMGNTGALDDHQLDALEAYLRTL